MVAMIRCGNCHQRVDPEKQTSCPECGHPVSQSLRENKERGVPMSEVQLKRLNLALILFMGVIFLALLNHALQILNAIYQNDRIIFLSGWWLQGLLLLAAAAGILLMAKRQNPWVWLTALGFGLFGLAVFLYGPPSAGGNIETKILVAGCLFLPVLAGATLAILKPSFMDVGIAPVRGEPLSLGGLGIVSAMVMLLGIPTERSAPGIVVICILIALIVVLRRVVLLFKRTRNAIPSP